MARKDISDLQVLQAVADAHAAHRVKFADELLEERTGQHPKVVMRAMERAESRGYIECGVSLRSGWLTETGKAFLESHPGGELAAFRARHPQILAAWTQQWPVVVGFDPGTPEGDRAVFTSFVNGKVWLPCDQHHASGPRSWCPGCKWNRPGPSWE